MNREEYQKAMRHISGYCAAKIGGERKGAFFESTRSRLDGEEDSVCESIAAISAYVKSLEDDKADLERVLIEDAEGDEIGGRHDEAEEHLEEVARIESDTEDALSERLADEPDELFDEFEKELGDKIKSETKSDESCAPCAAAKAAAAQMDN